MKIKMSLTRSSIDDAIKKIDEYQKKNKSNVIKFTDLLLDKGILFSNSFNKKVPGRYGTHKMEELVTFSKRVDVNIYGCTGVLIGIGQTLYEEWYNLQGEKKSGSINAIFALEFGTGSYNLNGGSDKETDWYFATDIDDFGNPINWKLGTAITPTMPMRKAALSLRSVIVDTAREVWG